LDSYSKEAWGEPKGLLGSRSKVERGVIVNMKGKKKNLLPSLTLPKLTKPMTIKHSKELAPQLH